MRHRRVGAGRSGRASFLGVVGADHDGEDRDLLDALVVVVLCGIGGPGNIDRLLVLGMIGAWPQPRPPCVVDNELLDGGLDQPVAVAALMASVHAQWEQAEWFDYGDVVARNSGTVLSLTGTHTATYAIGRRIQVRNQGSSTMYGTITNQTLTGGATQVTVAADTGSLTGTASAVLLGIVSPGESHTIPPAFIANRNILINGNMKVSQRPTDTNLGGTDGVYTACGRWQIQVNGATQGRFTQSQDTTSTGEFGYQLKLDCTTAEGAVASGESICVVQSLEAKDLQHLRYGNSAAATLALQFTITSPKSGTHCVALVQRDGSRSFVHEFTVAVANTAERITVTFPGDASGTINNDTGVGLDLCFPLICGSNFQAAANAWAAGIDFATSNQQNLLDNTSNDFYLTGVQIEVGSVTPFAHRPYELEFALCRRYYERIESSGGTVPGSAPVRSKAPP